MGNRQAFFQRVAASLIIPITLLPLAAILLAVGDQLHVEALTAAGQAVIRSWLPLFYGIGIAIGFTENDAMGALSVAAGFLVMVEVAEAVAGDPTLNVGVLGGIVAGSVATYLFRKVRQVELPEYLALFSGKRLGPLVAALAGVPLGYLFGLSWPGISRGIVALGEWMYASGGIGVFAYGATLRVLIPTGLHHILMQLVDYQFGGWVEPQTGRLLAGEMVRFLHGDPAAGRILSGFFLTLGFAPLGAGLAMVHEARPEQRRKVAGLMTTGILTAMLLGVTEPVEFAYLFASPLLFGVHIVLSGFASWVAWALNIKLGGYALTMAAINWHLGQNGWLLLPLGVAWAILYYAVFRLVIRWFRPPILGQVAETDPAPEAGAETDLGRDYLAALGGTANLLAAEACMTRLRLVVANPELLDDAALTRLGASAVLRRGGGDVQVVVGARAGEILERIRAAMAGSAPAPRMVTLYSPLTGRVLPLDQVPDPVFAGRLAGDGLAVEPTEGVILAPAAGKVVHVFPGGHAIGLVTSDGLELLIHVGINTVELQGRGFAPAVQEGDTVEPGAPLGRFDPAILAAAGKPPASPVLVTNPDRMGHWERVAGDTVRAGEPLLRVALRTD